MGTLQTLSDGSALLPARSNDGGAGALAMRSVLYAVFKHRWLVVGVFAIVFLGSALAALVRPTLWLAQAKVLVKLGESVQLAPAEAPSRSFNLPLNQEVVKTEADIAKSREVVAEAVRRIGFQPEGDMSIDEMVAALQAGLTATPSTGANSLQISFLGRNPERAARFVNAVTDVYLEHHNRVYRREGLGTFYDEQIRLLKAQMKGAQRRLRNYLRMVQVVDVDREINLLQDDVIQQEKGVGAQVAKIKATEEKLAQVKSQLASVPEQVAFSQEFELNPTVATFKNKLADLEVQRYEALQKYLPVDRKVQDLDAQIAQVKARLKSEQERVLAKDLYRQNELHTELQRNLFSLETLLADATAREQPMRRRLEQAKERLRKLRDVRFVIDNLQQDADQKRYAFDLAWKKHEEARIMEAMKDQSMVSISVLERAAAPVEPYNSKLTPLLLGLLSGLGLGIAMAVAVEYLNRRLRFEEEVERYIELPVLAVIPDLETAPDLARA
jgi:uncharacterized protein involved in exopolysaccharide biosynthesis